MFTLALGVWLLAVIAGTVASRRPMVGSLPGARVAAGSYWLGLAAAVVFGAAPLVAGAVDASDDPADFSVARATEHLAVLATEPHAMGSPEIEHVRAYLTAELQALGLEPELQRRSVPDYYGPRGSVAAVNVIARIEGTDPTGAVALVAHYDTVPETAGANDNGSGVAVLLDAARALLTDTVRNDVILLFTDGEEPAPRYGASAFADHRWFDDVRFVVNLEAIGAGGSSMVTEVHGSDHWIIDRLASDAPQPVAFSFLTETTELIGGSNTDFAVFRDAGVPGVELVYVRGSSIYHTPRDSLDRVNGASLQSHGQNALGLVRRVADDDLAQIHGGDRTYFTVGRHLVVRYPDRLVPVIVVLAGAALFVSIRRRGTVGAAARGAARTLAIALATALLGTAVWVVLATWRDSMELGESNLYLVVLVGLTAGPLLTRLPDRGPILARLDPVGVVGIWWGFGAVAALGAPGVSYLFALPALAASVTLLVDEHPSSIGRTLAATGTMLLTAVLLVPAIDTFYQFAQPRPGNTESEVLVSVAIPVLLVSMVWQLALVLRPRQVTTTEFDPTDEGRSALSWRERARRSVR